MYNRAERGPDEEELLVALLSAELPNVKFTTNPSSLTTKQLPYVVVRSRELDDSPDAIGQRYLVSITSSDVTRKKAKNLAWDIWELMERFGAETAGSAELGYINEVVSYKPDQYSTSTESVGREHLYHYVARYEIETAN